ncbi:hypothetical protein DSL72_000433 [Monilinia vaccinii-corymbosi]|uniref:Amino acid permease/ SLC12A domain-containing protein n=1 Tax=Monilinia vaccinii-corymbosi TaxID=61207 RepID=A0A8A3NYY0_9HELO|nr:hypothetical protein DSL72_000433 [Monilinia vaccinii-corymbosi]
MALYNKQVLIERKSIDGDKQETNLEASSPTPGDERGDTQNDLSDMQRLGKKPEFQITERRFNQWRVCGNALGVHWNSDLLLVNRGFTCRNGINGSYERWQVLHAMFYPVINNEVNHFIGQYHWVSEFSPPEYQKFLSYITGWMSSLGWVASFASSIFILTALIESIIKIQNIEYSFTAWQSTLIGIAYLLVTIGLNTWGARLLPAIETASLFGHLAGFVVTIVPLWAMAPQNSAHSVFLDVVNNGGWSNPWASCLIAQVGVLYCNIGSDSAVHISEEVEDASLNVPRAMWLSYILNATLGIITLVTMCFCIGPLDAAIASPVPYLVLYRNTGSVALATALTIILLILIFSGNVTALATTSRELWAFSRDNGFPFSMWISKMNHKLNVPPNAIYLTSALAIFLCLINLGSSLAFNIIISLSLLALLSTYMISIGCVVLKRIKGETLPSARWSLGRYGLVINVFAFAYSGFVMLWSCFPTELPVTAGNANWAPAVWFVVIVVAGLIYVVHGRKHYTPPVIFVES